MIVQMNVCVCLAFGAKGKIINESYDVLVLACVFVFVIKKVCVTPQRSPDVIQV